MPDYKELYLKMARATEKAITSLIQPQQEAEEISISGSDPDIRPFSWKEDAAQMGSGADQVQKGKKGK